MKERKGEDEEDEEEQTKGFARSRGRGNVGMMTRVDVMEDVQEQRCQLRVRGGRTRGAAEWCLRWPT